MADDRDFPYEWSNPTDISIPKHGKNKPFIVANVRDILELMDKEEISYSRGVEMFNEVAANFYSNLKSENPKRDPDHPKY